MRRQEEYGRRIERSSRAPLPVAVCVQAPALRITTAGALPIRDRGDEHPGLRVLGFAQPELANSYRANRQFSAYPSCKLRRR